MHYRVVDTLGKKKRRKKMQIADIPHQKEVCMYVYEGCEKHVSINSA